MADIPIQSSEDEAPITYQPVDPLGDSFENNGQVSLWVVGPTTGWVVQFLNGRECEFGDHPDYEIDVPVGQGGVMSPRLDPHRFNDKTGRGQVRYVNPVGLSVAAVTVTSIIQD